MPLKSILHRTFKAFAEHHGRLRKMQANVVLINDAEEDI